MKRKVLVLLGASVVAILGIVVADLLDWSAPREPRYDGKPLSYWCETLADLTLPYEQRRIACPVLKKTDRKAVPWLLWTIERNPYRRADLAITKVVFERPMNWLEDRNDSLREASFRRSSRRELRALGAARFLGALGSAAEPEFGRLVERRLSDGNRYGAQSLTPGASPYVFHAARSSSPQRRLAALRSLPILNTYEGEISAKERRETAEILAEMVSDPEKMIRTEAARVLGYFAKLVAQDPESLGLDGSTMEKMVERLIPALANSDSRAGEHLATALSAFREPASRAYPQLVALLRHPKVHVRAAAAQVLGSIGVPPEQTSGPLRELLRDPDEICRSCAAIALAAQGAADEAVILALVVAARREPMKFDEPALRALAKIGEPAADFILPVVLENRNPRGLYRDPGADEFAAFFSRFGKKSVPHLIAALSNRTHAIRLAAIATLPIDDERTKPALRRAVETEPSEVQVAILKKLEKIDAAEKAASK